MILPRPGLGEVAARRSRLLLSGLVSDLSPHLCSLCEASCVLDLRSTGLGLPDLEISPVNSCLFGAAGVACWTAAHDLRRLCSSFCLGSQVGGISDAGAAALDGGRMGGSPASPMGAVLVGFFGREGGMNVDLWSSWRGLVRASFLAQLQIWRLYCRLVIPCPLWWGLELVTLDVG